MACAIISAISYVCISLSLSALITRYTLCDVYLIFHTFFYLILPGQSMGQSMGSMDVSSQFVVALYTYDPSTDSPNDYPELELQFNEGDIIKVTTC